MKGIIENMPPEAREERLREITGALVGVVSSAPDMTLSAALSATASQHRMAVSQVKHGLSYALAHGHLRLDAFDGLTVGEPR